MTKKTEIDCAPFPSDYGPVKSSARTVLSSIPCTVPFQVINGQEFTSSFSAAGALLTEHLQDSGPQTSSRFVRDDKSLCMMTPIVFSCHISSTFWVEFYPTRYTSLCCAILGVVG